MICQRCAILQTLPSWATHWSLPFARTLSLLPSYNYGLPGKGKTKKGAHNDKEEFKVQGEVLFGLHPIHLALQAGRRKRFFQLYVDVTKQKDSLGAIKGLAERLQVNTVAVPRETLDRMSGNRPHQGVCLDAEPLKIARWNGQEHFPRTGSDGLKVPLWLMLYNIQDPMNFGAILRSAYFLGVEKVIVPAQNSCRLSPVVSKASAGAMELVDLLCVPERHSLASMCQWWKDQGGKVLGTGSNSVNGHSECLSIHECRIHSPTLIILGNEGYGISDDLVRQCDQMLSISQSSQAGGVESLNVSVAAGIILHWLQYSSGNVT